MKAPVDSVGRFCLAWLAVILALHPTAARAGMTVYDLTDVARLRLEDISFFLFLLVLAGLGIRFLWNFLAKDFARLPRLSFLKALSLTGLLSLLMLLILVMIAGARELLTPGAWYRQGSHYRPREVENNEARQKSIQALRDELMRYAQAHQGRFPPHDYVSEIPAAAWASPDASRTRYLYFGGRTTWQSNAVLVAEPQSFGNPRLVLLVDGRILSLTPIEIQLLTASKRGSS